MAFYKLYKIIHHRTDWIKLWRMERKSIMPEFYKKREYRGERALQTLLFMNELIGKRC